MSKEDTSSNSEGGQANERPTSNVQGPTSQYVQNSDQRTRSINKKGKE